MLAAESVGEIALRIAMAVGCGGILGWERERSNRPAGLRTHMMVALGGAAFTLLAVQMQLKAGGEVNQSFDPLRAVQGIIGGIGFLGAGTIIQSRGSVKGITTAATIWVVGALGVACGAGLYEIAVITVLAAFLILKGFGLMETRWMGKRTRRALDEDLAEDEDDDHRTGIGGIVHPAHRGADPPA